MTGVVKTSVFLRPDDEWFVTTIDLDSSAFEVLTLGRFGEATVEIFPGHDEEAVQAADNLIAAATTMRDRALARLDLSPTLDFDALTRRLECAPEIGADEAVDLLVDGAKDDAA